MAWVEPSCFASDMGVTSIESFPLPGNQSQPSIESGLSARRLSKLAELDSKRISLTPQGEEAREARDSVDAIEQEIVRRLRFDKTELFRQHYGIHQPDEALLKEVLDHFREKKLKETPGPSAWAFKKPPSGSKENSTKPPALPAPSPAKQALARKASLRSQRGSSKAAAPKETLLSQLVQVSDHLEALIREVADLRSKRAAIREKRLDFLKGSNVE